MTRQPKLPLMPGAGGVPDWIVTGPALAPLVCSPSKICCRKRVKQPRTCALRIAASTFCACAALALHGHFGADAEVEDLALEAEVLGAFFEHRLGRAGDAGAAEHLVFEALFAAGALVLFVAGGKAGHVGGGEVDGLRERACLALAGVRRHGDGDPAGGLAVEEDELLCTVTVATRSELVAEPLPQAVSDVPASTSTSASVRSGRRMRER